MSGDTTLTDWRIDLEDFDFLMSLPTADEEAQDLMMSVEMQTLDPRKVLRTENQGRMGSCRGHSGSTGREWNYTLETGEIGVQLSRMMLYVETQRRDGLDEDEGATIANGIKQMQEVGICEESLWPYPSEYTQKRPSNWDAVLQNAAKYKAGEAKRLTSYEGMRAFCGGGMGFVDLGIPWRQEYARKLVQRFNGGGGGHHAIGCFTLSERTDSQGRNFIWMFNSHGLQSGEQGWSEWSPDFIDGAIRARSSVFVAVSCRGKMQPRKFTLDQWKAALKS